MEKSEEEKRKAIKIIAEKIMGNAFRSLLLEMRFMDVALGGLRPKSDENVEYLGTNGKSLFYNDVEVVKRYKKNQNQVNHDIMHILLHCVFKHLFNKKTILPFWDLACDIAVEQLISTFQAPSIKQQGLFMKDKLAMIEQVVDQFNPQNIMTYLQLKNFSEVELTQLNTIFHVDDHDFWYEPEPQSGGDGDGDGDGESNDGEEGSSGGYGKVLTMEEIEEIWSNISRGVELNMLNAEKNPGTAAGGLQQKLKQVNREPYDYSKFLKKFSVIREIPKVNQDEFDYIFYTYGLELYDNMPLIEPLEYKDSTQVRDFVIAIDTSGSTSGQIVQNFLQKTYNILKTSESFGTTLNLFIIQCDAKIQEVAHITSQEYLEQYISNFVIKGLGGTDFRPVFGYVNKLLEEKVFTNLKGMLYFTDGYGTFPTKKTPYETAFVFIVPEDYENVTVPPWAIKVLLTEREIIEFKSDEI